MGKPGLTIVFEAPAPLLSMNQKATRQRREFEQMWRDGAFWAFMKAHPGVGPSGRAQPPSIVHTTLPAKTRGRRDPINFSKTVKHIVDGITNAGAWPDDTPDYCDQRTPSLYWDGNKTGLVYVQLEPM